MKNSTTESTNHVTSPAPAADFRETSAPSQAVSHVDLKAIVIPTISTTDGTNQSWVITPLAVGSDRGITPRNYVPPPRSTFLDMPLPALEDPPKPTQSLTDVAYDAVKSIATTIKSQAMPLFRYSSCSHSRNVFVETTY